MSDYLYPDTIDDQPFPGSEETAAVVYNNSGSVIKQTEISAKAPVSRQPALEVISSVLNTQSRKILGEFSFIRQGALQIGEYQTGISGDVRITPNGITARDSANNTTFNLDGQTGNASFSGTIRAGSVVSGSVAVGNNNVIIDGDSNRFIIYDDEGVPRILIGYQDGGF